MNISEALDPHHPTDSAILSLAAGELGSPRDHAAPFFGRRVEAEIRRVLHAHRRRQLAQQADAQAFDPSRLVLMLSGDAEKAREVLEHYAEDYPTQVHDLDGALRSNNVSKARYIAHTIRGSASNLGFTRIGKAAGVVEDALQSGDHAGVQRALDVLHEDMSVVMTEAIARFS